MKALLDRWEKAVANMVATIMTTKDEMSDSKRMTGLQRKQVVTDFGYFHT